MAEITELAATSNFSIKKSGTRNASNSSNRTWIVQPTLGPNLAYNTGNKMLVSWFSMCCEFLIVIFASHKKPNIKQEKNRTDREKWIAG